MKSTTLISGAVCLGATLAGLFFGCGPSITIAPDSGHRVYVVRVNAAGGSILKYNSNGAASAAVPAAINTGGADIVRRPGSTTSLYVAGPLVGGGNQVMAFNPSNDSLVATINNVGTGPVAIGFLPNGARAYVASRASNTVSVINTATNAIIATVNMPVGSEPSAIAVASPPGGGTNAYVSLAGSGQVAAVNTANNTITATVGVVGRPGRLAATPDASQVWVTVPGGVTIIDTLTNTIVTTVAVANPTAIAFNASGTRAFVSGPPSSVLVVDAKQYLVAKSIGVGTNPVAMAMTPMRTLLYVVNATSSNMSVIDVVTESILSTVPVGPDSPRAVETVP